ncbi:hypothetical protein [Limimaricola sp. AA108-03]|uniref:hypothetical protein n=1 Tax=Limimaricola sp. AA108-03 TaxID=3425945 RepID=UPI003D77CFD0
MRKTIIAGPSHIQRWKSNIAKGALPHADAEVVMVGFGGAPMWSASIRNEVCRSFEPGNSDIYLLIGDYRFGNSIFDDPSQNGSDTFVDGHSSIRRDLINTNSDRLLALKVEEALDYYVATFGESVKLIYWDMVGRRAIDMLQGRYVIAGEYNHPSWGKSFPGKFRKSNVVEMRDLFDYPLGEISRLYLDDSLHPTHVGYNFLSNIIFNGMGVSKAFDVARQSTLDMYMKEFSRFSLGGSLLISGNSVWVDTLRRVLGISGIKAFESAGIFIRPTGFANGRPITQDFKPYYFDYVLVVSFEEDIGSFSSNNPYFKNNVMSSPISPKVAYIPWEPSISQMFGNGTFTSPRAVSSLSAMSEPRAHWCRGLEDYEMRDLIEIGLRGEPNWNGIKAVVEVGVSQFSA